jgi:beta-lactamase regulating signal transducer with metallopeptidase domain
VNPQFTMSAFFDLNVIAQASALQIVDCLIEGTLIAIFAGLVVGAARRQNSGTRFAVWFSALIAIATLPLLGGSWWSHIAGVPAAIAGQPAVTLPGTWALYLFGAWAVVAGWLLIGVARGLWHLHVLRKSCLPVDAAGLDPQVRETIERNQSSRPATLCISDLVHVPTAIGFVKPVIAIPEWVMRELSPEELNQVLLHELAHLRRWDDWTNMAQKVVRALLFFHPAVWWIEKRVSLEREMACDDAVIEQTASPRAYAECLTHLAEKTLIQRSVALAQAALGRIRQTSLRIAQILDVNRKPGAGRAWKPAVSLVAGFAIVCVLGISREPKLIAFSESQAGAKANATIAAFPNAGSVNVSTALVQSEPARVVPTSLKARSAHRIVRTDEHIALAQPPTAKWNAGNIVRRTNVRLTNANVTTVAWTQTFFVVVEENGNGFSDQRVYQIQLWRVMIFYPVVDPDSDRAPQKEI